MKTLILDGHNAWYRLWKVMPHLSTDGQRVELIYGFLRLLRSLLEKFEPDRAIVCWDGGASRIRLELFPGYKGARRERREHQTPGEQQSFRDMIVQWTSVQAVLDRLSIGQAMVKGVEADDLVAMACRVLPGGKVIISADKDLLQLISGDVCVYAPHTSFHPATLYTAQNFYRLLGLTPKQYLEMRLLVGDKSDSIPGVAKGFGDVTAKELLNKYGSLSVLLEDRVRTRILGKGGRVALLYSNPTLRKQLELNRQLMDLSLMRSETAGAIIEQAHEPHKMDKQSLLSYFHKMSFESLVKDFALWVLPFENLGGKAT